MRKTAATIGALMLACAWARADEIVVKVGKGVLPYAKVRVINVANCEITFSMGGGQRITKPLSQVTGITLTGNQSFNVAEDLAKRLPAQAVGQYEAAARSASGWLATLIRYRRLAALDKAGMIDRSAEAWLAITDENSRSPAGLAAALKLRPTGLAEGRSRANARAIRLLEEKLKSVKTNEQYAAAVMPLLMELHQRVGNDQRATELAKLLAGISITPTPATGSTTTEPSNGNALLGRPPPPVGGLGSQLRAVAVLLRQGKAQGASTKLTENLQRYTDDELPTALLLLGKAQMMMFQQGSRKDPKLLTQAGVNFMRVVALYPGRDEVAEALYRAGRVNALLPQPNVGAARMAYERVLRQHSQSAAAAQAQKALASLPRE